jgi:hypothetical protein
MKAIQSRAIAMSDFFRAIAGDEAAQYDMLVSTVYSAAYSIMLAGNKTQFNKLAQDADMYGTDTPEAIKACKDAVGAKTLNAAAKRFHRVYAAIFNTLAAFPAPEMIKDLPKAQTERDIILAPLASDYADQFAMNFTTLLATPARTAEEEEQAKAEREAKKAAKEAEAAKAAKDAEREARKAVDAEVSARAERVIAEATAPRVLVQTVADLLQSGALPADVEAMLIEAVRTRETAVLLARVASTEAEAEPVAA